MQLLLELTGNLKQIPAPWLAVVVCLLVVTALFAFVNYWRSAKQNQSLRVELATAQEALRQQEQQLTVAEQQRAALELDSQALRDARVALSVAEKQGESLSERLAEIDRDNHSLREESTRLREKLADIVARSEAESRALNEKIELLQQYKESLTREFENLSNRIFEEKQKNFASANKVLLDGAISPLKEQLQEFKKKVDDVYSTESKERHVLKEQIVQLRADSLRIGEDANNLTRALKHDNKTQGNWGELTLVRALETCGLREPEEYETQLVQRSDDGARQIPDVVVHLPGKRDIIIDSKVSLLAYSQYFEAESDEDKAAALAAHMQSIRSHIKELSNKSYEKLSGINTLDYVMMYIPIEGASSLALQTQGDLWEEAYARNIVLVSPTNLLAILRSVETIWRHEKQNKNAEEIARQAGNLHDKFIGMIKSLEGVEKGLNAARKSYDQAFSQLATGRGNLVSRVKNLEQLGAKTGAAIPEQVLRAAELEDSEDGADIASAEQQTLLEPGSE